MDVTIENRSKIIALSKSAGMSQRNIVLQLGITQSTVCRVLKYQAAFNTLVANRKVKYGRKRKSSSVDDRNLLVIWVGLTLPKQISVIK